MTKTGKSLIAIFEFCLLVALFCIFVSKQEQACEGTLVYPFNVIKAMAFGNLAGKKINGQIEEINYKVTLKNGIKILFIWNDKFGVAVEIEENEHTETAGYNEKDNYFYFYEKERQKLLKVDKIPQKEAVEKANLILNRIFGENQKDFPKIPIPKKIPNKNTPIDPKNDLNALMSYNVY